MAIRIPNEPTESIGVIKSPASHMEFRVRCLPKHKKALEDLLYRIHIITTIEVVGFTDAPLLAKNA